MYKVEGMSCGGCIETVKSALKSMPGVIEAIVRLEEPQAIVSMQDSISIEEIAGVVSASGHYRIEEIADPVPASSGASAGESGKKKIWKIFGHKKDCCKP
jgi:copper chaperone CopZ